MSGINLTEILAWTQPIRPGVKRHTVNETQKAYGPDETQAGVIKDSDWEDPVKYGCPCTKTYFRESVWMLNRVSRQINIKRDSSVDWQVFKGSRQLALFCISSFAPPPLAPHTQKLGGNFWGRLWWRVWLWSVNLPEMLYSGWNHNLHRLCLSTFLLLLITPISSQWDYFNLWKV